MDIKELLKSLSDNNSKIFVVDTEGEVKMVIMNVEEYQNLLLGKLKKQVEDVELVNQEIIKAQLTEESSAPTPLRNAISKRAQELFKAKPGPGNFQPDLRSEVIDPSFDFEAPRHDLEDI